MCWNNWLAIQTEYLKLISVVPLKQKCIGRTSLVVQWIRIHLQMQGPGFDPWAGRIPHAAEQLSPCATTAEPEGGDCWAYRLQTPACDREMPPQWEACIPQQKSSPRSLQSEKACEQQKRPSTTKNKLLILENTLKMDQRRDIKHWMLWEYWRIKNMRELFFIILTWRRLKTDMKPRSCARKMLAYTKL